MDPLRKTSSGAQPPSLADKAHELIGNQNDNQKIQRLTRPHLDRLEMSWEADVEDVYPMIGTLSFVFMKDFPNPHKIGYITSLADPDELITALKASLKSWSSLRSIAVEYDQATRLVVVLRATQRYFDRAIQLHPKIEDEQALMDISMPGNHAASELPRGLVCRMVVAKVESTKTVGLVILINHGIFDAASLTAWIKDVEAMILGTSVVKRIHHKAFAEAYYLHQTSLAAKLATDDHVERLRGIGSMRDALWPPAHLFFSAPTRTAVPNEDGRIEAIEGGGYGNAQLIRHRHCSNLTTSSKKPSTLIIAAIAIFNTSMTGSKHSIFGVLLAGREWPFINDSMIQLLPDPMEIAGPTLTSAVALLTVDDTQQISQFLDHAEMELRLMRRHQHLPLDFAAHLSEADREVWYLSQLCQFFNYQPQEVGSKGNKSRALRFISDREFKVDQSNNNFMWECGLEDSETLRIRTLFNPDMFSEEQVIGFMKSAFDIVEFLSDIKNGPKDVRELRVIVPYKESPQKTMSRL